MLLSGQLQRRAEREQRRVLQMGRFAHRKPITMDLCGGQKTPYYRRVNFVCTKQKMILDIT